MFNPVCLKLKSLFQFGPTALPDYNGDPSENDKVHVLVFVVPAGTSDSLSDVVREKMKKIREEARDLGEKTSFYVASHRTKQ